VGRKAVDFCSSSTKPSESLLKTTTFKGKFSCVTATDCARSGRRASRSAGEAFPVAWNALLEAGRDHLGDVAPRQRDLFARQRHCAVLGPHLFGEVFDFGCARDERHEVEAEGVLDRAPCLSGEAFAVRRVAPDDQPGVDEAGQVPPQRRRRHAMGADREFLLRKGTQRCRGRTIRLPFRLPTKSVPSADGMRAAHAAPTERGH